jgi:hypothetical protein
MIAINHTLISEDIFDKKFVCDLTACKGACCVAGDSGAPLSKKELNLLDKVYPIAKPYMNEKGIAAVEKQGTYVLDSDGDYTTTLVSDGEECAFVFFDSNNIAKCSIEQAYIDGKTDWKKPISCHLYPIRVKEFDDYKALNFEEWKICEPACACGNKLDVPVYRFLKEPLIRAFGERFYEELQIVESELNY